MKVSEYYEMPIYSDNGNYIGEVQDIVLDLENGDILGLGFGKREGKVTTIPYDSVTAIGDIIIVQSGRAEKQVEKKE